MSLKTDYKDAVLASGVGTLRKYQQIDNGDGTISLQDASEYSQVGDKASASVFNVTNKEVNDHESDAATHITTLTCSTTGTVHALTGLSATSGLVSCVFKADADFVEGNTFTINGTAVTVQLQNGDSLPDEFFKAGATVPFIYDVSGAKLNFKAAGSTAEIFNFPLTISPNMPTADDAKAVGHLWVIHDTPADFSNVVLDDSVKVSYTNGYLMLVVDDTNNGSDDISQLKKLTTGEKLTFESHRDTINDTTLPWQVGSVNKNGNVFDLKRKYPVVYSRLNDVLDVETAYVWDGTDWIMVSQKGYYLFTNNYRLNRSEGVLSNAQVLDSNGCGSSVSPDRNWVAINTSSDLKIYKRLGDIFTLNSTISGICSSYSTPRFSPDSQYISVVKSGNAVKTSTIIKLSNSSWSILTSITATLYVFDTCWSDDGNKLYLFENSGTDACPWKVETFNVISDTFTSASVFEYLGQVYSSSIGFMEIKNGYVAMMIPVSSSWYLKIFQFESTTAICSINIGLTNSVTSKIFELLSNGTCIFCHVSSGAVELCDTITGTLLSSVTITNCVGLTVSADEKFAFVKDTTSNIYAISISDSLLTLIGVVATVTDELNDARPKLACW